MALDEDAIARIDALLDALGPAGEPALVDAGLAHLLPSIARRHCDAADVLEEPFRSGAGTDLHLLDTAGHCIRVTSDPAAATALLIALHAGQPA